MQTGERIRVARKRRGLTLRAVAEAIGVQETTVQRYESGAIRQIRWETLHAIADVLECSLLYILGITDDPDAAVTSAGLLTPAEAEHLRIFRQLGDEDRALVEVITLRLMQTARRRKEWT